MELNLRKPLIVLAILIAIAYYVRTHVTLQNVLDFSRQYPPPAVSAAIDYYAGMAEYMRGRYPESTRAFQQLLTDYPTGQYAADGLFRMGESYEETNQWTDARDAYAKYLEQFPEGRQRSLVQGKYDALKLRN